MKIKSIHSIIELLIVFNIYAATPDGGKVIAKIKRQVFTTCEMGPNDSNTLFIDDKMEGLSTINPNSIQNSQHFNELLLF